MSFEKIKNVIKDTYSTEEYPTLNYQMELWAKEQPFAGLTILDATPVFRNTMVKYLALIAGGAKLIVGISKVMPYDKKIIELLISEGIEVVHADQIKTQADYSQPVIDIILDCAASFIDWKSERGYVELTRSGLDYYTQSGKRVYLADSGRIKQIETCLGTGESYFRAMSSLGFTDWKNKELVIFGSGKVGRGLAIYAYKNETNVTIVTDPTTLTPDVEKNSKKVIDFRDKETVTEAISSAYAVVTATGVLAAVENSCDANILIKSKALLANMGVEDEYGASIPAERVLEAKRPLNFILEEPTHLKYIDATMALHNEGANYLIQNTDFKGVVSPSKQVEDELLKISSQRGLISEELKII